MTTNAAGNLVYEVEICPESDCYEQLHPDLCGDLFCGEHGLVTDPAKLMLETDLLHVMRELGHAAEQDQVPE